MSQGSTFKWLEMFWLRTKATQTAMNLYFRANLSTPRTSFAYLSWISFKLSIHKTLSNPLFKLKGYQCRQGFTNILFVLFFIIITNYSIQVNAFGRVWLDHYRVRKNFEQKACQRERWKLIAFAISFHHRKRPSNILAEYLKK